MLQAHAVRGTEAGHYCRIFSGRVVRIRILDEERKRHEEKYSGRADDPSFDRNAVKYYCKVREGGE